MAEESAGARRRAALKAVGPYLVTLYLDHWRAFLLGEIPLLAVLVAHLFHTDKGATLNVPAWLWVVLAMLGVFAAQYRAWFSIRSELDARIASDRLPEIRRPTKEEVEAWRAVKAKQDRGEKLSRKDRKLLATSSVPLSRRGFVDHLGMKLDLGGLLFTSLHWEGEQFQKDWAAFRQTQPDTDSVSQWLNDYLHNAINDAHDWQQSVRSYLSEHLDMSVPARFDNDAGLTARVPPSTLTDDRYISVWQDHDLRMQRLHLIIEERSRAWNL